MTLTLYFARRFLRSFFLVTASFCAVLFLVDIIEQIRDFGGTEASFGQIAWLAALNVPGGLGLILPLVTVLAGAAMFLGLARSSELVVARAAGRSALRMALAPAVVALLLGMLAVAALNPITAATAKRFDALSDRLLRGGGQAVSIGREGVWLRQSGSASEGSEIARHQSVIHAERANSDATELYDVTLMEFSFDLGPFRYLKAEKAQLVPGAWVMTGVKEWPLAASANPETEAVLHQSLRVPSDLTADRIRDSFGAPAEVSIWDLPEFIAALERAGFSSRRHAVWFEMELSQPLLLAAMVLIAAAFTMRHARRGGTGTMALMAFGAGVAALLLRNLAQAMGENSLIPVTLAAWAPPLVVLMAALTLILHLEDG
ncbi:MAG: LPS export ABC transporter permease LptG [Phaeovulum sp.]|uniref:LPS export ABC transporter permease LptG n=1 Tax=Phaeovulum sp. TaxID=2934796 RepID=UPI00272FD17D|nr:LPS export ABC transporter permease LptG [Phaeovulum sp.]MDP2063291.1 LPS export ABC transporter permease LptG [Phaeovulum sp.]